MASIDKKIQKLIVKFLCLSTKDKEARRWKRSFLMTLGLLDLFQSPLMLLKTIGTRFTKPDCYIIELNPFHMECLYAIHRYIKDGNHSTVILTTPQNASLNLFPEDVKVIPILPVFVKLLDRLSFFNGTRFIFAGSYYITYSQTTIESFLPNYIASNAKVLVIDHAPGVFAAIKSSSPNVHKFVLAEFLSEKHNLPFVYTCMYPGGEDHKREKDLLSVGIVGQPKRRDIDSLINIIDENEDIFTYIIACWIDPKYKEHFNTLKNVAYYENASFARLFDCCRKATFIPFLIHDGNDYYFNAISGNLNLSIGFGLIPIIERELGTLYGFDETMAIFYESKADLARAVEEARSMSRETIKNYRLNLLNYKQELEARSYQNIVSVLEQNSSPEKPERPPLD
ncbi:hypothetical protein GCM10007094_27050 [Pseudovibrio japonicus]|uniref:Uncharacterized protein n=1 Tax=Pseudovibrio japonicus TaxID=366534 RepID=A0ABQ3EID0_9HYPH|nr:hypothetical protein [Pseudovibrio japonicus]GHB36031.1 hypothetical protein GCM10007094_27050 [Pseudovibrio japonicus]